MNRLIICSFAIVISLFAFTRKSKKEATQFTKNQNFVLLELFTSQGCSSCPSADKLLEKTIVDAQKSGKKIIALSYHVDYWDRLGWKDPYSNAQFTQRQYDYAQWFQSSNVYTPQIIVNGKEEFVGSDKAKMSRVIDKILQTGASVNIQLEEISWKNNVLNLDIKLSNLAKNSQLNVALVSKNTETNISRGENERLKLKGSNVVRVLQKIQLLTIQNKVSLPIPKDAEKANTQVIAFIQDKNTNQILGAEALDF